MELYKLKANLFMYFNENTASVTPVEMHISGSRACMALGKAATQMLLPVLLSSGWTSARGGWKDFWQGNLINFIEGGCVEHNPVILLETKCWEITECVHLQTEISTYMGLFHPASKNAFYDAVAGCWSLASSSLEQGIILLSPKAPLPILGSVL